MVNEISNKATLITQSTASQAPTADKAEVTAKPVEIKQDEPALAKEATTTPLGLVEKSDQMVKTADRLNQIAQSIDRNLKFSVDDGTGEVVSAVIDRETDEVIRQIPEERVLAMRENIESLKGILFSAKI